MSGVWSTIGAFALGGVGWAVTWFVGSPFRRFYDLRGEVIHRSVLYGNVLAVQKKLADDSVVKTEELSDDEIKRLGEAVDVFRDLGARMRAFALNEPFAMWFVKWRYDPWEASEALLRVSNTLPTYGGNRSDAKKILEKSLRFRVTK
jgi:hypothetical protein